MLSLILLSSAFALGDADEALLNDLGDVGVDIDAPAPEAIINGEDATLDDYPMTGNLMLDATLDMGSWGQNPVHAPICSSTLIAPDVVLLASHCVDEAALTMGMGELIDPDWRWTRQADLTAYAEGHNLGWPEDNVVVTDFVQHPDWDMNALEMGLNENHDVALLFLSEALEDVPLGVLPTADEASQITVDTEVDVVGWGQQVATSMWEQPPAGTVGQKVWGTSYIAELSDVEFQVGAVEQDVRKCHGDSGGPTFMVMDTPTADPVRIIGVTSHAYDETDCDSKGGVDTRVDHYLGWIDQAMRDACADGTRVWCDGEQGILPPEAGLWTDIWAGMQTSEEAVGGCTTAPVGALGVWGLGLLAVAARRRR